MEFTEVPPDIPDMPPLPEGEKGWYVFAGFLILRYVLYPLINRIRGKKRITVDRPPK